MSIQKQFLKSKPLCKVTFEVPSELVAGAEKVAVLGDFNSWKPGTHELKKLKDGKFKATFDLETGKQYQFRYLVDDANWINDPEADEFVYSGVAQDQNCVITL